MANDIYSLTCDTHLPILDDKGNLKTSASQFLKGDMLLLLKERNISYLPSFPSVITTQATRTLSGYGGPSVFGSSIGSLAGAVSIFAACGPRNYVDFYRVSTAAREEFENTGEVAGSLFLTPNLLKVWISHYRIDSLLERIESRSD